MAARLPKSTNQHRWIITCCRHPLIRRLAITSVRDHSLADRDEFTWVGCHFLPRSVEVMRLNRLESTHARREFPRYSSSKQPVQSQP